MYGAVVVPRIDSPSMLQAGRALERVWLTATSLGLSFNIMAGIPLLACRVESDKSEMLNEKEKNLIRKSYGEIREAFSMDNGFIPFVFRMGKSKPVSASSDRLPLEKILL